MSTHHDGRFFDVSQDLQEHSPLKDKTFTVVENDVRQRLQKVLDRHRKLPAAELFPNRTRKPRTL